MFRIKTTIDHLHSLVSKQDEITSITIEKGAIFIEEGGVTKSYEPELKNNPIDDLYTSVHANGELCLDCLTDDNMSSNSWFCHLIRSYLHFLMINYGPLAPISRDMALFFLKNELLEDHKIVDKFGMTISLLGIEVMDAEERFILCQK